MARITHVAKAQKDQGNCRRCGTPIRAGEPYRWFANLIGRTSIRKNFCQKCTPRASDMTTSDKLSQLYSAQETLEDAIGSASCLDDLSSACNAAAGEAREVAEAYRESVSNMPDNLQQGSQAQEMEEKADNIESWADSLEQAASEIEGLTEEDLNPDDECAACGQAFREHTEEKRAEADAKNTEEDPAIRACGEFEPQCDPLEDARSLAEDACGELSV